MRISSIEFWLMCIIQFVVDVFPFQIVYFSLQYNALRSLSVKDIPQTCIHNAIYKCNLHWHPWHTSLFHSQHWEIIALRKSLQSPRQIHACWSPSLLLPVLWAMAQNVHRPYAIGQKTICQFFMKRLHISLIVHHKTIQRMVNAPYVVGSLALPNPPQLLLRLFFDICSVA